MAVSPLRAQPSACEPPCSALLPCPPFPRACRSPSPAATRPAPVHGHRFVTALTTNQEPGCNPQILAHARLISEIKSELNYQAWRALLVPPPCCRAQHGSAAPRGGRARLRAPHTASRQHSACHVPSVSIQRPQHCARPRCASCSRANRKGCPSPLQAPGAGQPGAARAVSAWVAGWPRCRGCSRACCEVRGSADSAPAHSCPCPNETLLRKQRERYFAYILALHLICSRRILA